MQNPAHTRERYPSDLSDKQWRMIEILIPPERDRGRHRSTDLREVVNGINYRWSTGCVWRMLPHDSPPWATVYTYFRRWQGEGTLSRNFAMRCSVAAENHATLVLMMPRKLTATVLGVKRRVAKSMTTPIPTACPPPTSFPCRQQPSSSNWPSADAGSVVVEIPSREPESSRNRRRRYRFSEGGVGGMTHFANSFIH